MGSFKNGIAWHCFLVFPNFSSLVRNIHKSQNTTAPSIQTCLPYICFYASPGIYLVSVNSFLNYMKSAIYCVVMYQENAVRQPGSGEGFWKAWDQKQEMPQVG